MYFFDSCMIGVNIEKYPRVIHSCQNTKNSCLIMHMQLHFRITWRKWLEHTAQNKDMNDSQ